MTGLAKTKCPATEMEVGGTKKDGATMIARSTATHNPIDRVLDCLDGVEQNGSGFKASCPVPGRRDAATGIPALAYPKATAVKVCE